MADLFSQTTHFDFQKNWAFREEREEREGREGEECGPFFKTQEQAEKKLSQVTTYLNFYDSWEETITKKFLLFSSSLNLSSYAQAIEKGALLSFSEYCDIFYLLTSCEDLKPIFHSLFSDFFWQESTWKILKKEFLLPFGQMANFKTKTFFFEKVPELFVIWKNIQKIEHSIVSQTQGLIRQWKEKLQYESYDVISEVIVLPVKAEKYHPSLGKIWGRSSTGHTFYVAPSIFTLLNQQLIQEQALLQKEIEKKLSHFAKILRENNSFLEICFSLLQEVDLIRSRALFSLKINGICPIWSKNQKKIEFQGLFHPLLENPISYDLTLESPQQGLCVSGPNTGGKTVFLKSLSLSFLLAQMGSFVPAQKAEIPFFSFFVYFGNDHQDLKNSLSSFSSEVFLYLSALKEVRTHFSSLLVIDEIFNSTDSVQASFLTISFLQSLPESCWAFFSTHHKNLKDWCFRSFSQKIVSSRMGFCPETFRPTYKLLVGMPGPSLAFEIFQEWEKKILGNIHLTSKAKDFFSQQTQDLEAFESLLVQKEQSLEAMAEKLAQEKEQFKSQEKSFKSTLELKKQEILQQTKKQAEKVFQEARELVKKIKKQEFSSLSSVEKTIQEIKKELPQEQEEIEFSKENAPLEEKDLVVGKEVYSCSLKTKIKISSLEKGKKIVIAYTSNGAKVMLPFSDLSSFSKKEKGLFKKSFATGGVSWNEESFSPYLDLRGVRFDEGMSRLERSLTFLKLNKIPFLEVVHGHGEGILKKMVREYLRDHQEEYKWSIQDGNDGAVTIYSRE